MNKFAVFWSDHIIQLLSKIDLLRSDIIIVSDFDVEAREIIVVIWEDLVCGTGWEGFESQDLLSIPLTEVEALETEVINWTMSKEELWRV